MSRIHTSGRSAGNLRGFVGFSTIFFWLKNKRTVNDENWHTHAHHGPSDAYASRAPGARQRQLHVLGLSNSRQKRATTVQIHSSKIVCLGPIRNSKFNFENENIKPTACRNPQCANRLKFSLDLNNSKFVDFQKVRIQEVQSELPRGCIPRRYRVLSSRVNRLSCETFKKKQFKLGSDIARRMRGEDPGR
jgi:hypothetical protein